MFAGALIRYLMLIRRLHGSVADENGIYYSDKIDTPFILGVISPKTRSKSVATVVEILRPAGPKRESARDVSRTDRATLTTSFATRSMFSSSSLRSSSLPARICSEKGMRFPMQKKCRKAQHKLPPQLRQVQKIQRQVQVPLTLRFRHFFCRCFFCRGVSRKRSIRGVC